MFSPSERRAILRAVVDSELPVPVYVHFHPSGFVSVRLETIADLDRWATALIGSYTQLSYSKECAEVLGSSGGQRFGHTYTIMAAQPPAELDASTLNRVRGLPADILAAAREADPMPAGSAS